MYWTCSNNMDESKTLFSTTYNTDKIYNIAEGSIQVSNSTKRVSDAFVSPSLKDEDSSTISARMVFFQGFYRVGASGAWTPMSAYNGSADLNPENISATCRYAPVGKTINVTAFIPDYVTLPDNNPRTVYYRVVLFDAPGIGSVITGKSSTDIRFSTEYQYQKILLEGYKTLKVSPTAASVSVPHTFGKPPIVRAFFATLSNYGDAGTLPNQLYQADDYAVDVRSTSTNVTFAVDVDAATANSYNTTGRVYYRIYEDG